MKLISLQLTNFKGIRNLTLSPSGQNVIVLADNGRGKTTFADAFSWLLFGKDSDNRKDYEIKTIVEGKALSGVDHGVEGVFSTDLGEIRFTRTYREKWTKKRGSATFEFTGHETDFQVDGVPTSEADYNARVREICPEKQFRALTDPLYFSQELKWEERRMQLLAICGDVSDADVIAGTHKLKDLPAILGARSLEDHKKVIDARRKAINGDLTAIPARIDEANRSMPAEANGTLPAVQPLQDRVRELNERRATVSAGGEVAEAQKKLNEIDAELIAIRNGLAQIADPAREEALKRKRELSASSDTLMAHIDVASRAGASLESTLKVQDEGLESLRRVCYAIKEEVYVQGQTTCATCGQDLPAEKLENALADWNLSKSRRLELKIEEGKTLRARRDTTAGFIGAQQAEYDRLKMEYEPLLNELTSLVVPAMASIDPETNDFYRMKQVERQEVADKLAGLRVNSSDVLEGIDSELRQANQELETAQRLVADQKRREELTARIEELKGKEKALATEYEKLERELFLCEEFIRSKVKMLTDRINERFKMAHFKLFSEQVNGGIAECCEATYNGVPFGALNHGAKVNVGLDIINTLAESIGFAPPIFIDGAESVQEIIETRGQQIRLSVPPKGISVKTLTMIKDGESMPWARELEAVK